MSKKRQKYFNIKFYEQKVNILKRRKESFELVKTTYTRKVLLSNNEEWIFNKEGDTDRATLILIQLVRNDAKKYIAQHGTLVNTKGIGFFNMFNVFDDEEVICKVDMKSAYWTLALQKGIITKETNDIFEKLAENYDEKFSKDLRLKALGSLATTKFFQTYENGILVREKSVAEITKPLYMEICLGVDRIMRKTNEEVEGCIYYYWDCIFVKKSSSEQVIDFFKKQGYDCSIKETRISYVKVGENGYIISKSDNKIYMTRRENYQSVKHKIGDGD